MQGPLLTILFVIVLLVFDFYILKGFRAAFKKWRFPVWFVVLYWLSAVFFITILLVGIYSPLNAGKRAGLLFGYTLVFIFKFSFLFFVFIDDIRRGVIYLFRKNKKPATDTPLTENNPDAIPRSEFLMKAGLLSGFVPLVAIKLSMSKGCYDYHVRYVDLYLPNLPKAFDGMKVGQISDIHSGGFYNKTAVKGGVDMLQREKPDVTFFTGDLVNGAAWEMRDYQDLFAKVKAPLGVYSILGNHDYGDYGTWPSLAAKQKNNADIIATHKNMGWDILIDENRRLKVGNEEIGILGIGNWGEMSRFPKYGKMEEAVKNTADLPVKLLLSHDPSHWRAEVIPKYPQIDAVFAGHTHGLQFGIRTKEFQWSPIEYVYSEWAGLYREKHQQIYVNVGYGFAGIRGRVGILPEITIFTLKAGEDPGLKV
ncbi:metallophosphoesterase [Mucilaginibacter terrigena]|uniref:Metallophosphoesterase n=1 Tax=Mucilaginibacter terrigena TaxID=2492395 RepID=A0A4Q5LMS3_9SPHI|nr:metallophosphoesterase [Mucilaginibacter terrigena]RYU90372.1 metallophosphoesterase [Mucilaginibacter terrigena]